VQDMFSERIWEYMTTVAIPARLRYAVEFYLILDKLAEENEYHERVFTGSMMKAYRQLGASSTYWTQIRKILVDSGSITILQRGTGNQASIIVLNGLDEKISAEALTRPARAATVGAEVERRVRTLEAWRETTGGINIAEALRNMERRLTKLEGKADSESVTGGKD
jgi:hypothetical protein